ncbi:3-deoxy-D-arabino-heptulosonate 7-phosphate synthase [Cupriavidus numazuensis]|uniref:3-deoxy-D-arabino-heptulosonate 7-phosphate synthase n=1 Tax=Cupriavidus numazuensis TaxID=221992 RepID=A0ABM8TRV2_9BURK|nr:3-deoxy-D-arabino-heptulosonate 7-phosphate synthase [Cupriavidus numazuensis]CAG2158990.1 hypothetical protein LMG26411_06355 [Cupriavidus numazuensis]
MPLLPPPALLQQTLRAVARRYRLPALSEVREAGPSTTLATVIEQARLALVRGETPDAALERLFVEALARLIHDAMRADAGDPVFQAMLLRHRVTHVREYASLSARAEQDRRPVLASVNALAHPRKPQSEGMVKLHALASSSSWSALHDAVQQLLDLPAIADDTPTRHRLSRLADSPELERLRRLETLGSDALVRQYRTLWDRQGPRSGTAAAAAQGVDAQRRGTAVEALTAQALQALARRLNEADGTGTPYRVVTSMRVPASIPAKHERAKTEWDAVLLRQAETIDDAPAWDICLLAEAKASADAATTDFPRLLRGMRLLAQADAAVTYDFETHEGVVRLRGASLSALPTDETALAETVLYCSNAPAETAPRLLSAASRMQLLSAQDSLDFAAHVAETRHADARDLEPVWQQLLESPRWAAVLNQYAVMREVRDLMVHPDDLLAASDSQA